MRFRFIKAETNDGIYYVRFDERFLCRMTLAEIQELKNELKRIELMDVYKGCHCTGGTPTERTVKYPKD